MDRLIEQRKELKYDKAFMDPIRELREEVDKSPWYPMNVNNNGVMMQIMGKGKTLVYPDGWRVQYCLYDQGQTCKKVVQISVKDHVWTDIPREFRHARANVVLDLLLNPDLNVTETAILPRGGIQIAQDEPHWSLFTDDRRALS